MQRLSILGVGLLGGSLGLCFRKVINCCIITGYGHRSETLEKAKAMGAIDRLASDAAAAVKDADLVVLCTPVGLFESLLRRNFPGFAAWSDCNGCRQHQAIGGGIGRPIAAKKAFTLSVAIPWREVRSGVSNLPEPISSRVPSASPLRMLRQMPRLCKRWNSFGGIWGCG